MSINNVKAVGDDQDWKREAETLIKDLLQRVEILEQQQENTDSRLNN